MPGLSSTANAIQPQVATSLFRFLIERGYASDVAFVRVQYLLSSLSPERRAALEAAGAASESVAAVLAGAGATEAFLPRRRPVRLGEVAEVYQRFANFSIVASPVVLLQAGSTGGLARDLPTPMPLRDPPPSFAPVPVAAGAAATGTAGAGGAAGGGALLGGAAVVGGALVSKEGLDLLGELREADTFPPVRKMSDNVEESPKARPLWIGDDSPPDILEVTSRLECSGDPKELKLILEVKVRDPDTYGNDTGIDLIEVWVKDRACGTGEKRSEVVQDGRDDTTGGNAGMVISKTFTIPVTCESAFRDPESGALKLAYAVRAVDFNKNSSTLNGVCTRGVAAALRACCPDTFAAPASPGAPAGGGIAPRPPDPAPAPVPASNPPPPAGAGTPPPAGTAPTGGSGTAPIDSNTPIGPGPGGTIPAPAPGAVPGVAPGASGGPAAVPPPPTLVPIREGPPGAGLGRG